MHGSQPQLEQRPSTMVCDPGVMRLPKKVLGAASKQAYSWLQTKCLEANGAITGVVEFAATELSGFFGNAKPQAAYDWLRCLDDANLAKKLPQRREGVLRYQVLDSSACVLQYFDPEDLRNQPWLPQLAADPALLADPGSVASEPRESAGGPNGIGLAPQASVSTQRPDQSPMTRVPSNRDGSFQNPKPESGADDDVADRLDSPSAEGAIRVLGPKPETRNASSLPMKGRDKSLPCTKATNVTNDPTEAGYVVSSETRSLRVSDPKPEASEDVEIIRLEAERQRRAAQQHVPPPGRIAPSTASLDPDQLSERHLKFCRTQAEAERLIRTIVERILSAVGDFSPSIARRAAEAVVLGDGTVHLPMEAIDDVLHDLDYYRRNNGITTSAAGWLNGALRKRFYKHGVRWTNLKRRPK